MRIISHRGFGLYPGGVLAFLRAGGSLGRFMLDHSDGFDVELDFWLRDDKLVIGHEKEEACSVDPLDLASALDRPHIWCHAKHAAAVPALTSLRAFHIFMNDDDPAALTSSGYVWTNYDQPLTDLSIAMSRDTQPEIDRIRGTRVAGVCTDDPAGWRTWQTEFIEAALVKMGEE